ncbi:MAG: MerR family transcriptional regulator [Acidimicrobiaceae bacterium]|nr:MerR family transcriptional regulator [Acidimicrobiaceae bacterium]
MNGGHRSIGEVLSLLSAEHPDLTISKIRFLESQGLIAPQRTPSGYRKFFETDIDRLNWILVQQRDHFLPLKEIKRRLVAGEVPPSALRSAAGGGDAPAGTPSLFAARHDTEGDEAGSEDAVGAAEPAEDTVTLTAGELARAVGSDVDHIYELQRLGLIAPASGSGGHGTEAVFDQDALLAARTVAALAEHGIAARNLRMFKVAADREAGVYEQLLGPLMARGATTRLRSELSQVVELTETLHRLLLRRLLRPHLD